MKQIEFNEGDFTNLSEVTEALFANQEDPTSINYKRELVRPKINWFLLVINCLIPIVLSIGSFWLITRILDIKSSVALMLSVGVFVLYIVINLKRLIIGVVRLYQRFAPDSIRNKCRFEPSCSQYMILALQKYGLIKGLRKGIDRLKRCNINDGGYDMP